MSAPPTHFLSLSRPSLASGQRLPFDVSTVAAADYDIDIQSGFMPPAEPLNRLSGHFDAWESMLDRAMGVLKLATDAAMTDDDRDFAELWRSNVREMSCLSVSPLLQDERQLRRAHVVLTYLMHFYVHSATHKPDVPIKIPSSLSIPLVHVSRELGIPPILTYADTTLWNWVRTEPSLPYSSSNLSSYSTFTRTSDENHFYVTSERIELRGVEALSLMRSILNETFLGDTIASRRVTSHLKRLAIVIDDISALLIAVRDACDPTTFYQRIRPWFNGGNSHPSGWLFEGVDEFEAEKISSLGGPSAGQSSLVHALDVFLGIDHKPQSDSASSSTSDSTFLERQKQYMPRHHRAFLTYLGTIEKPVRTLVKTRESDSRLSHAYNEAVGALKRFRDGHIRIATLYIVSQASRTAPGAVVSSDIGLESQGDVMLKGTGGTMLVPFLKSARDNTTRARMEVDSA